MNMHTMQDAVYNVWEIAMAEDATNTPDHLTVHLPPKGNG